MDSLIRGLPKYWMIKNNTHTTNSDLQRRGPEEKTAKTIFTVETAHRANNDSIEERGIGYSRQAY